MIIFHGLIIFLVILSKKYKKIRCKFLMKLFRIMTFTMYLRIILEAYMILALSSINELRLHNFGTKQNIVSFGISVFVCLICLLLMLTAFLYSFQITKPGFDIETSYFREFHDGQKNTKLGRIYMFVFILRRFVSVAWVVLAANLNPYIRIGTYSIIQVASLVYT